MREDATDVRAGGMRRQSTRIMAAVRAKRRGAGWLMLGFTIGAGLVGIVFLWLWLPGQTRVQISPDVSGVVRATIETAAETMGMRTSWKEDALRLVILAGADLEEIEHTPGMKQRIEAAYLEVCRDPKWNEAWEAARSQSVQMDEAYREFDRFEIQSGEDRIKFQQLRARRDAMHMSAEGRLRRIGHGILAIARRGLPQAESGEPALEAQSR